MSFWSADVINNASVKTNQLKVDLDVQSLNRKYDRTEYFDIEAALTVDFMGMFVEFVQGDLIKKQVIHMSNTLHLKWFDNFSH